MNSNLALLLPFLINMDDAVEDMMDLELLNAIPDDGFVASEVNLLEGTQESKTTPITYIREWWNEVLRNSKYDENLRREVNVIKEKWKEILKCLKRMEWAKVQSYLRDLAPHTSPSSSWIQYSSSNNEVSPAVMFWSAGGRIHYATDKLCKMISYSLEELRVEAGQEGTKPNKVRAHSLFHADDMVPILAKQLEESMSQTVKPTSVYHMKTRLVAKTGEEIPVSASVANVRDSTGCLIVTAAHFVPISSFRMNI